MKFVKTFLLIAAASLLLYLITMPLRAVNFPLSSLIASVCYFYLTMVCLRRYKHVLNTWMILLALLTGLWLLELPLRIIDFKETLISFPDIILRTLGVVSGLLYWQLKKPLNYATLILALSLPVFMYFQGYDYWLQKLNYGTFTGSVSYAQPATFEALPKNGQLITDNELKNKIVLLDFWTTSCGVCFQKFPYLQALHDKYKDDPNVMVMAVNAPMEGDKPGQAFGMIEERGYTFPVVITKDEQMAERFGVFTYPKTFIIAKDRTVVFYGDIWLAGGKIRELRSSLR